MRAVMRHETEDAGRLERTQLREAKDGVVGARHEHEIPSEAGESDECPRRGDRFPAFPSAPVAPGQSR